MPSVLFIAPSAYPLGGLATWLDYLVPGLRSLGWEAKVGLVSGHWHDPEAYLAAHPGLPAVRIANSTGSREGRVRALARVIRSEKPDIVAGVNIPDVFAAVERLRLKGGGSPRCVMTTHGIEPDLYEDMRVFREVLDAVVCTNRLACRLAVEEGGIEEARVYYAPYGVALPAKVGRESTGAALRVAFVGRLEESQKRVGDLATIAEALAASGFHFSLSVAGEGPDGPTLLRRLEPLVARGIVRFLGALTHADVQERLYPEVDVLLLTSSWETGPLVIWEAMASGVAVVSSRYVGSGLEGVLEHGRNCLLFAVGDADGAAVCLRRLSDAAARDRIAAAGRELVAARYTVERSVRGWAKILDSVQGAELRGGRARRPLPGVAGRLDRWIGPAGAETVRRLVGRSFAHREPGGEWPHSYGVRTRSDSRFQESAARLDQGGSAGGRAS